MQDPLDAVLYLLRNDDDLIALLETRVWGEKLPIAEASSEARPNVVVRTTPGVIPVGGYVELHRMGLDVFCYGVTPKQAKDVWLNVHRALKYARRQVIEETLLHSVDPIGSPRAGTDPDTQWDFVVSSWRLLASEIQAT